MMFFADTCTKRNTASLLLLVWLFALASSLANACILEMHEPHSTGSKNLPATISQAPADLFVQLGTDVSHHDDNSDGTKGSCLKVCDDQTHTLPKAYAGVDHSDPGPAPLVAVLWAEAPNVVLAHPRLDDFAIPIVGPPLRVRYSRFAL